MESPMAQKKVLIFAPYGLWTVHHQVDAVIGTALKLRGCDVQVITCDGVFKNCLLSVDGAQCPKCQDTAKRLFSTFNLPITKISSLIGQTDQNECRQWAEGLAIDEFPTALFEGNELGKWVAGGVHAFFKSEFLDYAKNDVVRTTRSFLFNAALLTRAYQRLLQSFRPDHILCYSGFHVYYRVIMEISRKIEIPVLVHERGEIRDSFVFVENGSLHEYESRTKAWEKWKDIPLSRDEAHRLKQFLEDREHGKDSHIFQNYSFSSNDFDVRRQLRIPQEAKMVTFFPTCDWEVGISKMDAEPKFSRQIDWLRHICETVDLNDVYIVIRHHPSLVRKDVVGRDFLKELFKYHVHKPAEAKIRTIMPYEKITSYSLLWHTDAALTWRSTIGVESMLRGVATGSEKQNHKSIVGINTVEGFDYNTVISDLIRKTEHFDLDDLRTVYRGAYFIFFRLSSVFKSFGIRDVYLPDLRIDNIQFLLPGNDPTLDAICNHVIQGVSLYPLPSDQELVRSAQEETEFLHTELETLRKKRSLVREHARLKAEPKEPPVSIVRIRQDGRKDPEDTLLQKTIRRLRYKNIEKIEMGFPNQSDPSQFLQELRTAISIAKGEFICFGTDNTYLDEALISTAIDFLQDNENESFQGLISGAWICEQDGTVIDEIFTERKDVTDYLKAVNISAIFENPAQLLTLFIWKKKAILSLLEQLDAEAETTNGLSEVIFNYTLSRQPVVKLSKILLPMVTICIPPTAQELVAQAELLIKEECWDTALKYLDIAKNTGRSVPGMDFARALTRLRLGKPWEALVIAEAHVRENPADTRAKELLYTLRTTLSNAVCRFDDVAGAISSVKGALVPGQEKFLFDKVRSLPQDAVIVEIGALYGRSTAAIAFACVGTRRQFYSIDTFRGILDGGTNDNGINFLDAWWGNIRRLGLENYVNPLPGFSRDHLADWRDKPRPDFVFIDGSHHYKDIIQDFELIYPLVKDGGWIAMHDVEPSWPGPWRVWRETAMKLLSEHENCSTISCGRKLAGKSYVRPINPSAFSYSKEWANHLQSIAPNLSEAMQLSITENEGGNVTADKIEEAERSIAQMPDYPPFKHSLGEMLKLEASEDPLLHLWYALTLEKKGDRQMARERLMDAKRISKPSSNCRIDMHLNRLSDPAEASNQTSEKSNRPLSCSRKPECLFLNTYYQGFIDTMYRKLPTLKSESYDQQKQMLQAQFFGDSDFYSRALQNHGWNAVDLIVNCYPLQRQWALENSYSGSQLEIAIEQIRRTRPTVLYLQDMAMGTREFLRTVRPYTDLIVGQIACQLSPKTDLKGFDIIFSSFPHYVDRFRKLGIMAYYQPLAFDERVLNGSSLPERQYPVTFVGGISNAHGQGNAVIERIAHVIPIDFWGYGAESLPADSAIRKRHHGEVWGLDMFSILRRSQITLNRHVDAAENYANNMRLFEATGCGSLLITDYKDNLDELFKIGKEVVAYRSAEECAALVHYYSQHPIDAQSIAKAGQQRTLRDHTYLNRMEQTAEIFERLLRYHRESSRYPLPSKISKGHKVIRSDQVTTAMTEAWQSPKIPEKQRGLIQRQLAGMYRGRIPQIYQVLADCLQPHADPGCSILEIGCSSGYYYEVLEYLLNKPISYTGVDYSESFIKMAKDFYSKPEFHVADGSNLPFGDEQFSVVISSCILLHVPNYQEHIRETARVSERFVIAHRTPVSRKRPTQYFRKEAYGEETVQLLFNEDEFISEFESNGLYLIRSWEYFSNPAEDRFKTTYLFQKEMPENCMALNNSSANVTSKHANPEL